MKPDWLDDLLDRHPGEAAPPGFAERVRARVAAGEGRPETAVLRPAFRRLLPAAAAALVFLAVGFWLGRREDPLQVPAGGQAAFTATLEELEMFQAWDMVVDETLDLGWEDAGWTDLVEEGG